MSEEAFFRLFQGLPREGPGSDDSTREALRMKGRVLAIHGLLNWITVVGGRFTPRSRVRSITASLNRT